MIARAARARRCARCESVRRRSSRHQIVGDQQFDRLRVAHTPAPRAPNPPAARYSRPSIISAVAARTTSSVVDHRIVAGRGRHRHRPLTAKAASTGRSVTAARFPQSCPAPAPLEVDARRRAGAASPCTIDNPKPLPRPSPLVEKNGSIAWARVPGSMPTPLSLIDRQR